ncbi:hypothetical protein KUCAC02_030248 [Chaenocephalus aceratus]|uniref:Uncharacterized protein n=1 Tax=Chaenocephalus aceratus TaxID=36190 RepID=A0ACB9XJJ1_CHAAC|nr:hypothetical protein KUCAC02_030248 [Chaenocephalus aceratus]
MLEDIGILLVFIFIMVGYVLLVILMCQKPQMSVQHDPGEHILFACALPGSADHGARCNLYFGEDNHPVRTTTSWKKRDSKKRLFCRFTVTIDDFLRSLHLLKRHDASCDSSLGSEANSLSPRSDGYSLTGVTVGSRYTGSFISRTPVKPTPGPEKPSRQASQNEDSDIYHVYSTISEEPPPSALNDMVYSTLQAY